MLLALIRLNNFLVKRVTRSKLGLALFIFNNPPLIPSNMGYKSTLSIILGKPLLSFTKNRS